MGTVDVSAIRISRLDDTKGVSLSSCPKKATRELPIRATELVPAFPMSEYLLIATIFSPKRPACCAMPVAKLHIAQSSIPDGWLFGVPESDAAKSAFIGLCARGYDRLLESEATELWLCHAALDIDASFHISSIVGRH